MGDKSSDWVSAFNESINDLQSSTAEALNRLASSATMPSALANFEPIDYATDTKIDEVIGSLANVLSKQTEMITKQNEIIQNQLAHIAIAEKSARQSTVLAIVSICIAALSLIRAYI